MANIFYPSDSLIVQRTTSGSSFSQIIIDKEPSTILYFGDTLQQLVSETLNITASRSITASYAVNGGGSGTSLGTGSTYPFTSSWSINSVNGSSGTTLNTGSTYPITASWAVNTVNGGSGTTLNTGSTYPITSSWATNVVNGAGNYTATGSISIKYVSSLSSMTGNTASIVHVQHYAVDEDGGGGSYYWRSSIPSPWSSPNALVIAGASGYWIRINVNHELPAEAVGCKPDNSTDNLSLLGNAMLLAQQASCSLLLSDGTYKVSNRLVASSYGATGTTKTFTNLTMIGRGMGKSKILSTYASSTNNILYCNGSGLMKDCLFKDFTLSGSSRAVGFYCSMSNVTFDHIESDCRQGGFVSFDDSPQHYITINGCYIHDVTTGNNSAIQTWNNAPTGSGVGWPSVINTYWNYTNNRIEDINVMGIECRAAKYVNIKDNWIKNWGKVKSGPPHAIYLSEGNEYVWIENNYIELTNWVDESAGIHTYDHSVSGLPYSQRIKHITIANNYISHSYEGIILYGASDVKCYGNTLIMPTKFATGMTAYSGSAIPVGDIAYNVSIYDNHIIGGGLDLGKGIVFGTSTSSPLFRYQYNIRVYNNFITGFKRYPIAFGGIEWEIKNNTIEVITGSSAGLYAIEINPNISSHCDDGIIDGNTIYNLGGGSNPMGGINGATSNNIVIQNNVIRGLSATAIKYNDPTGIVVNNIVRRHTGSAYDTSSVGIQTNNYTL